LTGHTDMIVGAKWSPDSKYIAASENEG